MNITLSSDQKTIERTRDFARRQGLSLNELLRRYMNSLSQPEDMEAVSDEFTRNALECGGRSAPGYRFSREDASIVAAAESAGCRTLYSEDLGDGQFFDHVQVRNPFR